MSIASMIAELQCARLAWQTGDWIGARDVLREILAALEAHQSKLKRAERAAYIPLYKGLRRAMKTAERHA